MTRALLILSSVAFAAVVIGYIVAPWALLSVVGIESTPTADFLIRTEGVALVSAAIFVWAARDGSTAQVRLVLLGLALYFILGALVDLSAFASSVVGPASVPSGVVRILIGALCVFVALRGSNGGAVD